MYVLAISVFRFVLKCQWKLCNSVVLVISVCFYFVVYVVASLVCVILVVTFEISVLIFILLWRYSILVYRECVSFSDVRVFDLLKLLMLGWLLCNIVQ
jgi:hypothetical protein